MESSTENKGITAKSIAIEEFFETYNLYIPKYQREYEWTTTNIDDLFNDIIKASDYYIGNIMIKNIEGTSEYELIDGQQRCISIFIILCSIFQFNKEQKIFSFNKKLLYRDDDSIKIKIDDRASDTYCKVLHYILNGSNVETIKNTNEYKNFKKINGLVKKYKDNIEDIYKKICNCQIVYIDTSNSSLAPDKMFLNLNIKGVKLTNDTIIRSMIFSELKDEGTTFDDLKNSWYDVFNSLKNTEKDNYLSYFYVYNANKEPYKEPDKKDNKIYLTKKELIDNYQNFVKKNPKGVYNELVSQDSIYRITYDFVVNGNIKKYEEKFGDSSVHFEDINRIIKMIEDLGYEQFNVAIIAALMYSNANEKKIIKDNIIKITCFIKWIYMYSTFNSLKNQSPSQYANSFFTFAAELRNNKKSLSQAIKDILQTYNCKIKTLDEVKGDFEKIVVSNIATIQKSSKVMKYVKALISFLDDDYSANWNGEHIIRDSDETNSYAHYFSNIIPVSVDPYGDLDLTKKIKLYEDNKVSEKHIKIFLENDYYYNGSVRPNWEEYRKNRYLNLIVEKYNEILKELLK